MNSCDEVIRELAVPTDRRDPSALAGHLASCPACAAWADRAAGFDRLWEATRPSEPSSAAWDALWANVAGGIAAPAAAPATPLRLVPAAAGPGAGSSWRRKGRVALGLAQAAALLVAAVLLGRQTPAPRKSLPDFAQAPPLAASAPSVVEVDIDAGQVIVIQGRDAGWEPVEVANERAGGLDDQFVMLGSFESLAQGGVNW